MNPPLTVVSSFLMEEVCRVREVRGVMVRLETWNNQRRLLRVS